MTSFTRSLLPILCLAATVALPVSAQESGSAQRQQGLDEEVQRLKEEVLSINEEMIRLEERLVYPASTQVALFLSIEPAEDFRLDSIHVDLDGEPFTRHVYSFRELDALLDGAVQRLHVGNVRTGTRRLDVRLRGTGTAGFDFDVEESLSFDKPTGPGLVELRIVRTTSRTPGITLRAPH